MSSVEALQKEGNARFAAGDFQGALGSYAAALSAAPADAGETKAALRANRSICCLKMGNPELALAEAEQSKELRPDWPKAHFRAAAALEALARVGDARLALCEAARISPQDPEVAKALQRIRGKIFRGPAVRVGAALDALEDFRTDPAATRAAAQELRDLLLGEVASGAAATADREACVRAFMEGAGAKTVFRRQNAMSEHWLEECKNGTMSLLSEVDKASPLLEQELVRLNREVEVREQGCKDGDVGCTEMQPGKAGDASLVKPTAPTKATRASPATPEGVPAAPTSAFGATASAARRRRRDRERAAARQATAVARPPDGEGAGPESARSGEEEGGDVPTGPGPEEPSGGEEGATPASLGREEPGGCEEVPAPPPAAPAPPPAAPAAMAPGFLTRGPASRRRQRAGSSTGEARSSQPSDRWPGRAVTTALTMLPVEDAFQTLSAAAAVDRTWSGASAALCSDHITAWASWAEPRWPGLGALLLAGGCTPASVRQLLRRSAPQAPPQEGVQNRLAQWSFVLDVRRGQKLLWSAALGCQHLLPGVLPAAPGDGPAAGHVAWPTFYERADVVLPGDPRRLAVSGVVAGMAAAAEGGVALASHAALLTAVHGPTGRLAPLPAALAAGSRTAAASAPAATPGGDDGHVLLAVVGLSVRQVLPGPKARAPPGSIEVRTGLSLVGPDGAWLGGGALALAALLEAEASWHASVTVETTT